MKGETSGNRLAVVDLITDCDDDTVLVRVHRQGDGTRLPHGRAHVLLHDRSRRPEQAP